MKVIIVSLLLMTGLSAQAEIFKSTCKTTDWQAISKTLNSKKTEIKDLSKGASELLKGVLMEEMTPRCNVVVDTESFDATEAKTKTYEVANGSLGFDIVISTDSINDRVVLYVKATEL